MVWIMLQHMTGSFAVYLVILDKIQIIRNVIGPVKVSRLQVLWHCPNLVSLYIFYK